MGNLVGKIVSWVAKLPGKLFSLGVKALNRLVTAISQGTPKVLARAAKIFQGVVNWIAKLPGKLFSLGRQAVNKLAGAVQAGVSRLKNIANLIFMGIVAVITKLPGKLLSLGQQAVNKFAGAVKTGVGKLKSIAVNIADGITGALKSLPGQMLSIGSGIVSQLASGILSGLGKIKDAASAVASAVKNALPGSPVKEGPLTAWNRGGDASGGGANVIDAITSGLRDTAQIEKAMASLAKVVALSMSSVLGGLNVPIGSNIEPMRGQKQNLSMSDMGGGRGGPRGERTTVINIYNPKPETGSESLTRTARNLAYLGMA